MRVSSVCWSCEYASNIYKCKWSLFCALNHSTKRLTRNVILNNTPNGVILNNDNTIVSCPCYKFDNILSEKEKIKKEAKKLNLSYRYFLKKKGK